MPNTDQDNLTGKNLSPRTSGAPMGVDSKKQLIEELESLPDDQKKLVAAFVESLKQKTRSVERSDAASIANRLKILEKMDALAVEISKQWDGDQDAAELVSSMRR